MSQGPVRNLGPKIIRRGSVGRVSIELTDCNNEPVNASALTLRVLDIGDQPYLVENFFQTLIPPFYHRIVKPAGTIGQYFIDFGNEYSPATLVSTTDTYPTNFVGGETLTMQIDRTVATVTFQAGDQSLAQVITRINGVFGPLIGINVASDVTNHLGLTSKQFGTGGRIYINAGSPLVLTALGLTIGTFVRGVAQECESDGTRVWLFEWIAQDELHPSETIIVTQTVYIMPGSIYGLLPQLRLTIDKALKFVDPSQGSFLGYTDEQLLTYILGGIQTINSYQPSIFFTLDNFPYQQFGSMLIEAALLWGVCSQTLFSIDSDVTSYSDQGQSFVINHQGPLAAYLNSIGARLDRNVPLFKLHFVRTGSVYTQMGPNYRLQSLLSAAPNGALFRNVFSGGPGG